MKEHGELSAESDGCPAELSYQKLEQLVRQNKREQQNQHNNILLR